MQRTPAQITNHYIWHRLATQSRKKGNHEVIQAVTRDFIKDSEMTFDKIWINRNPKWWDGDQRMRFRIFIETLKSLASSTKTYELSAEEKILAIFCSGVNKEGVLIEDPYKKIRTQYIQGLTRDVLRDIQSASFIISGPMGEVFLTMRYGVERGVNIQGIRIEALISTKVSLREIACFIQLHQYGISKNSNSYPDEEIVSIICIAERCLAGLIECSNTNSVEMLEVERLKKKLKKVKSDSKKTKLLRRIKKFPHLVYEKVTKSRLNNLDKVKTRTANYSRNSTTTLGAHDVRGHWRNQPSGAGGKIVKRIWINAHRKGDETKPLRLKTTKINLY